MTSIARANKCFRKLRTNQESRGAGVRLVSLPACDTAACKVRPAPREVSGSGLLCAKTQARGAC